jgi:hypothetical protein
MEMNDFLKYTKRVLWIVGYIFVLPVEILALVIMGYLWAFMFLLMFIFVNIEDVVKNGIHDDSDIDIDDVCDMVDNAMDRLPEPWCISVWIDKHYRNLLR